MGGEGRVSLKMLCLLWCCKRSYVRCNWRCLRRETNRESSHNLLKSMILSNRIDCSRRYSFSHTELDIETANTSQVITPSNRQQTGRGLRRWLLTLAVFESLIRRHHSNAAKLRRIEPGAEPHDQGVGIELSHRRTEGAKNKVPKVGCVMNM